MTYMVCDGDGYALTDGLQEHEAYRVAQSMANNRGESVWLSESGSEGEGEEVEPEGEDEEENEYTFSFMISGEITVLAKNEEQAEALARADLEVITTGGQQVYTEIERCDLEVPADAEETFHAATF